MHTPYPTLTGLQELSALAALGLHVAVPDERRLSAPDPLSRGSFVLQEQLMCRPGGEKKEVRVCSAQVDGERNAVREMFGLNRRGREGRRWPCLLNTVRAVGAGGLRGIQEGEDRLV